ncbi:MAG: 4-alpha-glucanotransferase [Bacteroidetes bacterium]|nr:MAG: 4-alpha-glucanotransferase [Bacteroidota bacterium]
MSNPIAPLWKHAPFIRLLLPLIAGIICNHLFEISRTCILTLFLIHLVLLFYLGFTGIWIQFKFHWLKGLLLSSLLFDLGILLINENEIRNNPLWFMKWYQSKDIIVAVLDEYPGEKQNSWKIIVEPRLILSNSKAQIVTGKIIVYLERDDHVSNCLLPGATIFFKKSPQELRNTGNPGAFDYKQYCNFQGITHQVYLRNGEFLLSKAKQKFSFYGWCQSSRFRILEVLQKYIPREKEKAVAEALLLGYRDELDKDLVQAYANTGVVHIIAISGMHLALIYGLLLIVFRPLFRIISTRWIGSFLIVLILWIFSFLAGGGASIIRSAVMFTFIILADLFSKKNRTFNSIAGSAFLLLCSNPYFLWDAGFLLSYGAVLSIVIFYSSVYRLITIRNKIIDAIWKLNAVTISAQILTFPLGIYLFHQFPNYFLLANILTIPLSSFIIYGEIILYVFSFFPTLNHLIGKLVQFMIWLMNTYVEWVNHLPLAVSTGLQNSLPQTILIYCVIFSLSICLRKRSVKLFILSILFLILFVSLRTIEIRTSQLQMKIVVYNIPKRFCVDLIAGNRSEMILDSSSIKSNSLNPVIISSGMVYRTAPDTNHLAFNQGSFYYFLGKKLLIVGKNFKYKRPDQPIRVDLVILMGTPKVSMKELSQDFNCPLFVASPASPAWKISQWKNECDSLLLRFHSVPDEGAFILEF